MFEGLKKRRTVRQETLALDTVTGFNPESFPKSVDELLAQRAMLEALDDKNGSHFSARARTLDDNLGIKTSLLTLLEAGGSDK